MTFVPKTDDLLYDEADGIGWLTLNRPEARNALTFAMYEGIGELASGALEDLPKVIVISGAGDRAFAAGTDIAQFTSFSGEADVLSYEGRMSAVLSSLEGCLVPTIAAIRGACTGGGAAIAGACDLRIGAPSALFGVPVARTLGNCLSGDNYLRLARIIGPSRLKEIIFRARLVGATESREMGWLHEITPNDEGLLDEVATIAQAIAGHAPLTLMATKRALSREFLADDEETNRELVLSCYLSEDFREGVDAFLHKRAPLWQGR
jgi:enoyl-CoA hydratase/carnithine racemase